MAKAYWICIYRLINDPASLAAYGKLAGPALTKFGGRMIVRGAPAKGYEGEVPERTVIVEFDSVKQAMDAHDSLDYQEALKVLGTANRRDLSIVEGVE